MPYNRTQTCDVLNRLINETNTTRLPLIYQCILDFYNEGYLTVTSKQIHEKLDFASRYPAVCNGMRNICNAGIAVETSSNQADGINFTIRFT